MRESKRLTYEGAVYIRPIGRGIVLEDHPRQPYLDDWIEQVVGASVTSGWEGRLRITVEVLE